MGFFSDNELAAAQPSGCRTTCSLFRSCRNPQMGGCGSGETPILFIADQPSMEEDDAGKPGWLGQDMLEFRKMLKEVNKNIMVMNCRKINAVSCFSQEIPNGSDVASCRGYVFQEVYKYKPKLIFLIGDLAIQSFYGHQMQDEDGAPSVRRMRGFVIPDHELGCWVAPIEHPSLLRQFARHPVLRLIMMQDIKNALEKAKQPLPEPINLTQCLRPDLSVPETIEFLQRILKRKPTIAFDYETTGLKPHKKGHAVFCIGVAVSERLGVSFRPSTKEIRDLWQHVLRCPDIPKVGWNLAMEDGWSRQIFKCDVRGWLSDARLVAHLEDNRAGITGLKFQSFLHYGIKDYSDEVAPFLRSKSKEEGENAMNRIKNAPYMKLMTYNATDALLTLIHHYRQVRTYETL